MSRRGRALAFVLAALVAAAAAAAVADGYGDSVARGYGALRPVVVARAGLDAGQAIEPRQAASELELRRVPARFVPPGALENPAAAIGLVPDTGVPAGSYLLASQDCTHRERTPALPWGWGAAVTRSRSRSAVPRRCWSPGPSRLANGWTWW